jgi:hypothetical protein
MARLLVVLALSLLVAGCGDGSRRSLADTSGGKLSAKQTALALRSDYTPPDRIHCVGGSEGWDYECRVTFPGRGWHPTLEWVRVDADHVTDETYSLPLPASKASAAETTPKGAELRHLRSSIGLLALDGDRVAYLSAIAATPGHAAGNRLMLWNVGTGTTRKVSDIGSEISELAIARSRVAWLLTWASNTQSADTLYTESILRPQVRRIATQERTGAECAAMGSHCAGRWIGGLVGVGSVIVVNRFATSGHPIHGHDVVSEGGLYALDGSRLKLLANGAATVEAASADQARVAVLHRDGTVGLYSKAGRPLLTVTPTPRARAVAINGRNLVVLGYGDTIALYDARTGARRKTFPVRRPPTHCTSNEAWCKTAIANLTGNLGVQGNIAIYTTICPHPEVDLARASHTCSAIHALDLSSGKDRVLGTLTDGISVARIDSAGLVYAGNGASGKGTLVFVPRARVASPSR